MAPPVDPRVTELNSQSMTWLIVALAGFWLGLGFVTGPLSWMKAGRIRTQYAALGLPASGNATGAWIVGIVCTALYGLVLIGLVSCFAIFAGAAATNGY